MKLWLGVFGVGVLVSLAVAFAFLTGYFSDTQFIWPLFVSLAATFGGVLLSGLASRRADIGIRALKAQRREVELRMWQLQARNEELEALRELKEILHGSADRANKETDSDKEERLRQAMLEILGVDYANPLARPEAVVEAAAESEQSGG